MSDRSAKKKSPPADHPEIPFDFEVEKTVLGTMFMSPEAFYEAAAAGLRPEDFHLQSNRVIYLAICGLAELKMPIDLVVIVNYLQGQGELESVGGTAYVGSLIDGVPDVPSIGNYVEILKDASLRRQMVRLCDRGMKMASDPTDPIKWTIAGMSEDLLRVQGAAQEKKIQTLKDFSDDVLTDIANLMHQEPDRTIGIPFGLPDLNYSTTGMRPGELIICGGYPGSGKTSFALDVARINARVGTPVAVFSVEMRKAEVLLRLWAQESNIPHFKLRRPTELHTSEFNALQQIKLLSDEWPLYVDDEAKAIGEIIPRAHLYVHKYGVKVIIVDFLQIVQAPGEKEYEQVSNVADGLRDLAKKLRLPVLCLSQLTRPEDKKGGVNVIPNMMMLRSSGKIEQNAHLILFTHHPEDEKQNPTGEDLIVIGKQRAGPKGRVDAFFDLQSQRWEPRGPQKSPPVEQETIFAEN